MAGMAWPHGVLFPPVLKGMARAEAWISQQMGDSGEVCLPSSVRVATPDEEPTVREGEG